MAWIKTRDGGLANMAFATHIIIEQLEHGEPYRVIMCYADDEYIIDTYDTIEKAGQRIDEIATALTEQCGEYVIE